MMQVNFEGDIANYAEGNIHIQEQNLICPHRDFMQHNLQQMQQLLNELQQTLNQVQLDADTFKQRCECCPIQK